MSQQQTWTEWFFGSANPGSTDSAPPATTPGPRSGSESSTSPYGPYVRTGRGGAGNFTWQSEQNAKPSNSDVEAHNPQALIDQASAAANLERHDTEAILRNQRTEPSEYVRVGRGYVERKQLQAAAAGPTTVGMAKKTAVTTASDAPRVTYSGRGGAGNYAAATELNDKQRMQQQALDRLDAEQRREQVIEDVEAQISAPPEAWLGGSKKT